jgi:GINS complex subunit 3
MMAVSELSGDDSNGNETMLVTLEIPAVLGKNVRKAIRADPRTINLRALAPYYYAYGTLILDYFNRPQITRAMQESMRKRGSAIKDQARHPEVTLEVDSEFLRGLDEFERDRES